MERIRSLAVAAGCLILSTVGFACGSDRSERDTAPAAPARTAPERPTNIVGNDDIRRTTPGTPQRSIMTWAQAVQFGDLAAVRSAYSARVRRTVGDARIDAAAREVAAVLGRPEIVAPIVTGNRARVRVALLSFDAQGRRYQQPTTFVLRREDGRWRLDDARLLLDAAAAMRRAPG